MCHALDGLLDDRTFIKLCRDEVRGRANELHSAVMRLLVGTSASEAWKEGVVDVDDSSGQLSAQVLTENLHVTGQHDNVHVVRLGQAQQF